MKTNPVKMALTAEEAQLINLMRNYNNSYPNGYPNLLDELMEMFQSMLRQPY